MLHILSGLAPPLQTNTVRENTVQGRNPRKWRRHPAPKEEGVGNTWHLSETQRDSSAPPGGENSWWDWIFRGGPEEDRLKCAVMSSGLRVLLACWLGGRVCIPGRSPRPAPLISLPCSHPICDVIFLFLCCSCFYYILFSFGFLSFHFVLWRLSYLKYIAIPDSEARFL